MGDPVQPVDIDAVVDKDVRASWQILQSQPRWDVWRDENRRRPRTRADLRGRIAVRAAAVIASVVAAGGLVSYAIQFQALRNAAVAQVYLGIGAANDMANGTEEASPQWGVENAARASRGTSGFIAVANGTMLATTPNVKGAANDAGFIKEAAQMPSRPYDVSTYVSPSIVCVYTTASSLSGDGSRVVVNVVDLTPGLNRMNLGYLTYGLVGLGIAGAAGGTVYWRLGRRLNKKVEPDTV